MRGGHQSLAEQWFRALGRECGGAFEILRRELMLAKFELRATAQQLDFKVAAPLAARSVDGVEQLGVLALRKQRIAEQRKYGMARGP